MNDIQPSLAKAGEPGGFVQTKSYGALYPVQVCFALGNQDRWRMVEILSDGQPRAVADLARALGRKFNGVSKHVAILRRAGIVAICHPEGANRRMSWHEIPAAFRATPGVLDFGCCTVRL
jgi:hypothetical protein